MTADSESRHNSLPSPKRKTQLKNASDSSSNKTSSSGVKRRNTTPVARNTTNLKKSQNKPSDSDKDNSSVSPAKKRGSTGAASNRSNSRSRSPVKKSMIKNSTGEYEAVPQSDDVELDDVVDGNKKSGSSSKKKSLSSAKSGKKGDVELDCELSNSTSKPPDLTGDYGNLCMLLVLYTLQGIPMGIASTMPLIFKERGVSYSNIGIFNLCSWPFSLKLLWAPFVDSFYSDKIGRRKTWLLPTQFFIGVMLIVLSYYFESWLGGHLGATAEELERDKIIPNEININALTASFFMLYFLCATQDIAVDGWSLTVLREENVGYQSMANAAGQTFGYAFSFIGALSLQQLKLMQFDQFMACCGVVFFAVTAAVGILKKEKPVPADEQVESVTDVYKQVILMLKNPLIRMMIGVLLTWKVGYTGCEAITTLKLQEKGVPKEQVAALGGLVTIVSVFIPFMVGKWTSGARPLDITLYLYIPRLVMCCLACLLVFYTPNISELGSNIDIYSANFPWLFYISSVLFSLLLCFISTAMFCASMGIFARVAPKDIAGTYLTMLNMCGNLGAMWVTPLSFYLVDLTTVKDSKGEVTTDGYYIVSVVSAIIGFVMFPQLYNNVTMIQDKPKSAWMINKSAKTV